MLRTFRQRLRRSRKSARRSPTNLRSDMRKAGVEYVVLKNHIVSRAAHAAGIDDSFHTMLKGPNAFAFGHEDAVAPAKVLKDAIKKYKKCEIMGGIINGTVSDACPPARCCSPECLAA